MLRRHSLIPFLALVPAFLCTISPSLAGDVPAAGEPCKGTLQLGGKTYPLKYAVAYPVKNFEDIGTSVVFAEQPVPVEKLRAALREGKGSDDRFFFFKPHVTVTFDKAGKAMFCNAYADNNSLSVSGSKLTGELTLKDGRSIGKAALDADEASTRKGSFSVAAFDLTTLVVPGLVFDDKPATTPEVEKSDEETKSHAKDRKVTSAPSAEAIPYNRLPLPADATDVEYKKLVHQIKCGSPTDYKTVAKTLSTKLAEQGWKAKGSDLVGPKSAILKRERGEASLTIFVKPAEGGRGSTVTVMSEGLSWEE